MTLAIVGICLVLAGSLLTYRAFIEAGYVEVIGRSTSAELQEETHRLSGSSTSSRHWKLFVTYEYWVGGQHFTSDRVASRRPGSNASSGQPPSVNLQALLESYEPGSAIKVYVSPYRPERSVLIKAGFGGGWVLVGGLCLVVAALAVAYRLI